MKKQIKITKTKEFKQQEKKLPKEVKKALAKALEKIAKNPHNVPGSMSIFAPPSPEELKQWMAYTKAETIDTCLEYLIDKGCLNKKGRKLAKDFWIRYIKEQ